MSVKTKTNLILDLSIFAAFLAVASPSLTGMTIHEWLALSLAAAVVAHMLFHWDWVINVSKSFFKKLFHQSRLNFIVNMFFLVTATAAMFSGLLISKSIMVTLGIQLNADHSWETLHKLTADWSLIALGLHFALHAKWLAFSLKRYLVSPAVKRFSHPKTQPLGQLAAQPIHINEK